MPHLASANAEPVCAARKLPLQKKFAYSALATLLAVVLLEFSLWALGVDPTTDVADPSLGLDSGVPHFEARAKPGEPVMWRTARNKLPWLNDQQFAIAKLPTAYRVFCLGGSTTFGRPYDDATSFAGWLREMLAGAYPNVQWEVVNAGGVSYASYRVAALMAELAQYEPDLFIVYTGHNEFLEERSYGLGGQRGLPKGVLSITERSRIVSGFRRLFAGSERRASDEALPARLETILDRSVGPAAYERDDVLQKQIVAHFELSIERMISIARSAGAEIVFVRPACKLRGCAPFKSTTSSGLDGAALRRWTGQIEQGESFFRAGQYDRALELLQEARQAESRFAKLHYLVGEALFAVGQYERSRAALERAVDEDVCPLRMTSVLAAALDRVVERRGAMMVDYGEVLRQDSIQQFGHSVLGEEYFFDHVHPTIGAHGLLAKQLMELLSQAGVLPDMGGRIQAEFFAAKERVERRIDQRAEAEARAQLACVLHWAGKTEEAGPLALRAIEYLPERPRLRLIAGIYLTARGEHTQAELHLKAARRLSPNDPRVEDAMLQWERTGRAAEPDLGTTEPDLGTGAPTAD